MFDNLLNKTDSGIILIFIIIAIVVITLAVPIYKLRIKSKDNLLKVLEQNTLSFKENTKVLAQLEILLEQTNTSCEKCKNDQMLRITTLESKQDHTINLLTEIKTKIS